VVYRLQAVESILTVNVLHAVESVLTVNAVGLMDMTIRTCACHPGYFSGSLRDFSTRDGRCRTVHQSG